MNAETGALLGANLLLALQASAQLPGDFVVATEAKGSDVFDPAFTPTFNNRNNMVSGPGAEVRTKPRKLLAENIERAISLRVPQDRVRPLPTLQLCLLHQ